MLTRADILKRFNLYDRATFEIEPYRNDQNIWRIKLSHKGDPAKLMSQGCTTRLVDEISLSDPNLAKQITDCLAKAKRYSKDANIKPND